MAAKHLIPSNTMHKPLIATRLSKLDDSHDLADIDAKAFEISWTSEHWYELMRPAKKDAVKTIIVATYYGNAVGFAVAVARKGEAIIEKLAVKQQFRRKGAGRQLLLDVIERAQDQRLKSLSLIMPESFVYPDESGELNPAIHWAKSVGLRPTTPFIKDHFTGYGTTEDGVKFTTPLIK